jgi:CRP/FNR family cyclic AMP-dependent transcriptional regulator
MKEIVEFLKRVPLFSELNEDERTRLAEIATERRYARKQLVFMEGEPREAVYFICSGSIKIFKVDEDGDEQVINLLKEGEMFPHIGFFDDGPYPASAEVIQEATLLNIRLDDFERIILESPQIAMKLMRIMGRKMMALQQRLQEMISDDVYERVVHNLLRLAEESGKQKEGTLVIEMPITHQDFANMVGASRESINRIFNRLKKENLLKSDRQSIAILDIERLRGTV